MAKIIPINQKKIDECREFREFIDQRFLNMSLEERAEKYQIYLQLKETVEDYEKRLQGDAENYMNHDKKEERT